MFLLLLSFLLLYLDVEKEHELKVDMESAMLLHGNDDEMQGKQQAMKVRGEMEIDSLDIQWGEMSGNNPKIGAQRNAAGGVVMSWTDTSNDKGIDSTNSSSSDPTAGRIDWDDDSGECCFLKSFFCFWSSLPIKIFIILLFNLTYI